MGVRKLLDAPRQIEKIKGLGSIPSLLPSAIAIGVNTTATAAFDRKDDIIIDNRYKIDTKAI